jgi:hypothetical protein
MDPITTSIVIVLGKYALDQGANLAREAGPKALETARELFTVALDRLRREPRGDFLVEEFATDPETYQEPVKKKLAEATKADPDFAAQLQKLMEQFETAAKEHAAVTGATYKATLKGSGAIAQGTGSTAVGAGGVYVGGDLKGGVRTGQTGPDEDRE